MERLKNIKEKNCILLVDDDSINREVMKNIFCEYYTFEEAENGLEGLKKLEECSDKLCALFLDVNMPVMGGIELLKILNERGATSKIPVFLITAHDEQEIAEEAYHLGVMDVITKPVTPFIILRRVQSVVELYQAREVLNATVNIQEIKLKENADTIDELHKNTIEALASAIEFRDVESGEHTNRIYGITKYILSETEFGHDYSEEEIENMAIGSIMHDIGKIAISDIILNKPGKLTHEEFEVMKLHTVKGAMLMEQLSQLQSHPSYIYASDIARHHHERWDGRGYPDGLKGDEISICSQATSIADVYDALVSPRVYKKAFSADKAVEMIVNGECGIFNPKLIECFLRVEPEIRKWYQEGQATMGKNVSEMENISKQHDMASKRNDVSDVLLLTAALQSAYDMVICSNLTQNTYYMIDYDRFLTHCADYDGSFDDLIIAGASSIPETDRKQFVDAFSRDNLVSEFFKGKKSVRLIHSQYDDSGNIHTVSTNVLFVEDPRNGDIRTITLVRYIDM